MSQVKLNVYSPKPEAQAVYDELYEEYRELHDYFGRGANRVMARLKARQQWAAAAAGAGQTGA